MIRVALIGAGGMGRVHLKCYRNNPQARIVAICDLAAPRMRDDGFIALSKKKDNPDPLNLTGIHLYEYHEDLLAREEVDLVDICLPSRLHAPVSIAALQRGRHVFCEKPMAMTVPDCQAMQQAALEADRQLVIGHSLRYMPSYTAAHDLLTSGRLGRVEYARFHRSGGIPVGSHNNWLTNGAESGGVALDLHVHDIDTAHWWFGTEKLAHAFVCRRNGLPTQIDSHWQYPSGLQVHLHAGWSTSPSAPFRMAYTLHGSQGTLMYDSAVDPANLHFYSARGGCEVISFSPASGNQLQVDDIIDALQSNRPITRITPDAGTAAVAVALHALEQGHPDA